MTFPPPETFDPPPEYDDYRNNATRKLRISPPPTATTTSPFPSRRPQKHSNNSRSRTTSMTASAVAGGQGVPAAKRSDVPTDFYISVDLHLPPKASVGLSKVCSSLPPPPSSPIPFAFCQPFHNHPYCLFGHSPPPLFPRPSVSVGTDLRIQPTRKRSADSQRLKGAFEPPSCALPKTDNFL